MEHLIAIVAVLVTASAGLRLLSERASHADGPDEQ